MIDREGKKWRFVFDSSIKAIKRIHGHQIPVDIGLYKVEMNSPKLEYSEMGKLQEVVRALRHAGAVVNGSCGMHVHVDASHHTPQSLKNALSCALPGFVDSKNEEKTERNAGYLVVSHSGGGMLRQGTRKGIRRTPANRGMRAHWVVKGLDISEDVCHGMCP